MLLSLRSLAAMSQASNLRDFHPFQSLCNFNTFSFVVVLCAKIPKSFYISMNTLNISSCLRVLNFINVMCVVCNKNKITTKHRLGKLRTRLMIILLVYTNYNFFSILYLNFSQEC